MIGTKEMSDLIKQRNTLTEDQISTPTINMMTRPFSSSSSRGFKALFCNPWVLNIHDTQTCILAKQVDTH